MTTEITNYQCPACTGPLHYSAETGRLECDYCGSSYTAEEIEERTAERKTAAWDTGSLQQDWGGEAEGMHFYTCPSCSARMFGRDTEGSICCPYCGNPAVLPEQFSGLLRPDWIIPFSVPRSEAIQALQNHYRGKILLPSEFRRRNHIEEIRGIYVPFWLYDARAEADLSFHATRTMTTVEGDYEVTRTQHFHVEREGSLTFEKVPVDASERMPDDFMDSIEPYDYSALEPFRAAYLPGFLAERYDQDAQECAERADLRCENSVCEALRETVIGYQTAAEEHRDVRLHRGKVSYALLPVWILTTKWKGRTYMFAMNGQTGRMAGDLPVDWKKFWLIFAGVYAVTALVLFLFLN